MAWRIPIGYDERTYNSWRGMLNRCLYPSQNNYPRYGGRGITICDEWRVYRQFEKDMGKRPSKDHALDRIDNMGNYEPGNCKWSTRSEQQRNSRRNVWVTYQGRRVQIIELCEELGRDVTRARKRLGEGMSVEDALHIGRVKDITYNGKTQTMRAWAAEKGLPRTTLHSRLNELGWSMERAMETPHTPKARINEAVARTIKILLAAGVRPVDIQRQLSVSENTVTFIRRGDTWKHVTIETEK